MKFTVCSLIFFIITITECKSGVNRHTGSCLNFPVQNFAIFNHTVDVTSYFVQQNCKVIDRDLHSMGNLCYYNSLWDFSMHILQVLNTCGVTTGTVVDKPTCSCLGLELDDLRGDGDLNYTYLFGTCYVFMKNKHGIEMRII